MLLSESKAEFLQPQVFLPILQPTLPNICGRLMCMLPYLGEDLLQLCLQLGLLLLQLPTHVGQALVAYLRERKHNEAIT